jgi:hypothetical protein
MARLPTLQLCGLRCLTGDFASAKHSQQPAGACCGRGAL